MAKKEKPHKLIVDTKDFICKFKNFFENEKDSNVDIINTKYNHAILSEEIKKEETKQKCNIKPKIDISQNEMNKTFYEYKQIECFNNKISIIICSDSTYFKSIDIAKILKITQKDIDVNNWNFSKLKKEYNFCSNDLTKTWKISETCKFLNENEFNELALKFNLNKIYDYIEKEIREIRKTNNFFIINSNRYTNQQENHILIDKKDIQMTNLQNNNANSDFLLKYEDKEIINFKIFVDGDYEFFFKSKSCAQLLGYSEPKNAIKSHIEENEKFTYEQLLNMFPHYFTDRINSYPFEIRNKKTIFINEFGFYSLIFHSKMPKAIEIKKWIKEVIKSIRKNGYYINNNHHENIKNNEIIKKQFNQKPNQIIHEPNFDISEIALYSGKNVLYIGFIGIINGEHVYKYGNTIDINDRIQDHKKTYGKFDILYIQECNNKEILEDMFRTQMKSYEINRCYEFDKQNRTELFATSEKYPFNKIKIIFDNLITKFNEPTEQIHKRDEKINELNNKCLILENDKKHLLDKINQFITQKNDDRLLINQFITQKNDDRLLINDYRTQLNRLILQVDELNKKSCIDNN